jgi:hypothetical protein
MLGVEAARQILALCRALTSGGSSSSARRYFRVLTPMTISSTARALSGSSDENCFQVGRSSSRSSLRARGRRHLHAPSAQRQLAAGEAGAMRSALRLVLIARAARLGALLLQQSAEPGSVQIKKSEDAARPCDILKADPRRAPSELAVQFEKD